ncbi:hypothetical protein [Oscillatoria sp. HE19RPO]|uniref:hypothetical protein n=1 Tax=Oscillatoria sp. HE19RPO TaxID=2954806 RepID=UPI0020C35788|nr:hypothetical protein [Oscillatoria sp. HE19RPO]
MIAEEWNRWGTLTTFQLCNSYQRRYKFNFSRCDRLNLDSRKHRDALRLATGLEQKQDDRPT